MDTRIKNSLSLILSRVINMGEGTKKVLWFGISTAIILGMIYFAGVEKFIDALSSADLVLLIPAFITGFSVLLVFAFVWYRFMRKAGMDVSYLMASRLFFAGQFMNSVTPLGQFGGEPFMAYIIQKNTDTSYEKAFSTVFSADIVNAIPVLTFVFGGTAYLILFRSINDLILQTLYAGIILTGVGGLLVYFLWFKAGVIESKILGTLEFISDKLGRGEAIVESAEERLERVQESFATIGEEPWHLFETAVVAHLSFVLQVVCLYFILLAMGGIEIDFTPLYFVIAIAGLANFTPTPGGSGAYEATMAGILTFFLSMDTGTAVLVAITFRLTTYWPGLLVGYLSLLSVQSGDGE